MINISTVLCYLRISHNCRETCEINEIPVVGMSVCLFTGIKRYFLTLIY